MNPRILVIAAHPDDEILGCGGTIARYIAEGWSAQSIILGQGMLSRGKEHIKFLNILRDSARKANSFLGIENIKFYDFPDNAFDSVSLLKIVKIVEHEIFEYKPDIVFTHHGSDLNIDHRRTFEAVVTACRPQPGFKHPDIYTFFVPSSTDWIDGRILENFVPNTFVDIENYIEKKLQALSYYKSEMREYPHPRSVESLRIFSNYWGNRVGKRYVEPLCLIRKII